MQRTVHKCEHEGCLMDLVHNTEYCIMAGAVFRFCCHEHGVEYRDRHLAIVDVQAVNRVKIEIRNHDGA